MKIDRRIVDNRVFLLGLDELYREAMKRHEREELLGCARETAGALSVAAAEVPVEGYYSEDERLTEYFLLVRVLQHRNQSQDRAISTKRNPATLHVNLSAPTPFLPSKQSRAAGLGSQDDLSRVDGGEPDERSL
jgi:hypothetical protein